jgi:hypothetical protein
MQQELELQAELDFVYEEAERSACNAYHGEQIARHVHALIDQDHDNVNLYVEDQDNDNGNLVNDIADGYCTVPHVSSTCVFNFACMQSATDFVFLRVCGGDFVRSSRLLL